MRVIAILPLMPSNFTSEIQLVKLFQMIREIHINEKEYQKYLPLPKGYRQINYYEELSA